MFILGLLLPVLAALALSVYLGYGLVKLLLPAGHRDDEGLLAPLLGYAFLLLIGYYGVTTVLNLRQVLFTALGLGTILNALALWRCRDRRLHLDWREHIWAVLLAGLAFLLGLLPLLNYGYVTVIGENWDPEFYLPFAEYLLHVPIGGISSMPPSPLRDLSADPARIALTPGFSIAQGVWQQLVGQDALHSFAPTLAILRALGVLAAYLLFRRTLEMPRRAAVLATALTAAYALSLWLTFFNFGIQLSSLPLVPLGLLLLAEVLRRPTWGGAVATGLAVAAIPVAYYPALTAFLPMAGALALAELFQARKRRPALLAGLGAALCTLLLAWGPILAYGQGFAERYAQTKVMLWLNRLITWSEALGWAPLAAQPTGSPPDALLGAVLVLLVLLGLFALVRSRRRWSWLALVASGVLYLLWLRGDLGGALAGLPLPQTLREALQPYPYAYMKGAVYVAPLLVGLAVQGLAETAALRPGWGRRVPAMGAVAIALLFLGLAGWSAGRIIARYWEKPALFDRRLLSVEEAAALVPAGEAVYLTDNLDYIGPATGLLSYFFRDHPLRGTLSGAYSSLAYCLPGEAVPYALLDLDDNPYLLGLFPEDRLWQSRGMALYRRNPEQRAFLDLREGACPGPDAQPVLVRAPLTALRLAASGGCRALNPDVPLLLYTEADGLSLSPTGGGDAGFRALLLGWSAEGETPVSLRWSDGQDEEATLPAGFSIHRSAPHHLPATVEISGSAEISLCWAAVVENAGPQVDRVPRTALLSPQVRVEGSTLFLDIRLHVPERRAFQATLEVWQNDYAEATHYAWWGPVALSPDGSVWEVNLQAREAVLHVGEATFPLAPHRGQESWPAVAEGTYFASLWISYGGQVLQALPVALFDWQGGRVQNLSAEPVAPVPLYARPLATPAGFRFGREVQLVAYERPDGPWAPGEVLPLAVEWRAESPVTANYAVTAQVIADGRILGQVDLPLGGEGHPPTTWRRGEEVRDDLPVRISPQAAGGRYRLILAVYDPSTMQRLPAYTADGQPLGDALDLGEVLVR
ncbi:MAG: hypothetical protein ACP5OO_12750 [Chloroflexia bacterium]